jgi:hypothetical protein
MAFKPGYHERVCAKADISVPGHNRVLTRRQQQADLVGRRQGVSGMDTGANWQPHSVQTAGQPEPSY